MPKTRQELEQYATRGLLDKMLTIREFPDPAALLSGDSVAAWKMAVEACLDLLVPALKRVAMLQGLPPATAQEIAEIIGRVPLKRDEKGRYL